MFFNSHHSLETFFDKYWHFLTDWKKLVALINNSTIRRSIWSKLFTRLSPLSCIIISCCTIWKITFKAFYATLFFAGNFCPKSVQGFTHFFETVIHTVDCSFNNIIIIIIIRMSIGIKVFLFSSHIWMNFYSCS